MMSDTVWNIFIRFCDSFSLQPPLFSASTLAFSDSYFFLMGPPPFHLGMNCYMCPARGFFQYIFTHWLIKLCFSV